MNIIERQKMEQEKRQRAAAKKINLPLLEALEQKYHVTVSDEIREKISSEMNMLSYLSALTFEKFDRQYPNTTTPDIPAFVRDTRIRDRKGWSPLIFYDPRLQEVLLEQDVSEQVEKNANNKASYLAKSFGVEPTLAFRDFIKSLPADIPHATRFESKPYMEKLALAHRSYRSDDGEYIAVVHKDDEGEPLFSMCAKELDYGEIFAKKLVSRANLSMEDARKISHNMALDEHYRIYTSNDAFKYAVEMVERLKCNEEDMVLNLYTGEEIPVVPSPIDDKLELAIDDEEICAVLVNGMALNIFIP